MMSDGIAKEVAANSELGLLDYLTSLHTKSHSTVSYELTEWMNFLEQRNDDDKSFCTVQAEE